MRTKTLTSLLLLFFINVVAQVKVTIDNYYNNEFNKNNEKPYHYLWTDSSYGGFSEFGKVFKSKGADLQTLTCEPTKENLGNSNIYIIVDPDNFDENPIPHFMTTTSASAIEGWVKEGGVLLVMANAKGFCDLDSINLLSTRFGFTFNKDLLQPEAKTNKSEPRNFNSCAITNLPKNELFAGVQKVFMKEVCSLTLSKLTHNLLDIENQIIIAESKVGKGYVLFIGDPWFYNEYIDHAVLPNDFDNLRASNNLVDLLIGKCKQKAYKN